MGLRLKSIRQRVLLLVLIPVLSLIGLYIFATSITASDAINLARTDTLKNATIAAIQQGWQRGRSVFDAAAGRRPGSGRRVTRRTERGRGNPAHRSASGRRLMAGEKGGCSGAAQEQRRQSGW